MTAGLTARQRQALQFINRTMIETGCAPSYREIAGALGLRAKSGAHRLVVGLQRRGYLGRIAGHGRSLTVIRHTCPHCGEALQPALAQGAA